MSGPGVHRPSTQVALTGVFVEVQNNVGARSTGHRRGSKTITGRRGHDRGREGTHLGLGSGHEACGRHVGGGRFCVGGEAVGVLVKTSTSASSVAKRAAAPAPLVRSGLVVP